MNKKQLKEYEKSVQQFIEQMREYGVKDETINKVMSDINEYQQKQYEQMVKEMYERFKVIMMERLGEEDE